MLYKTATICLTKRLRRRLNAKQSNHPCNKTCIDYGAELPVKETSQTADMTHFLFLVQILNQIVRLIVMYFEIFLLTKDTDDLISKIHLWPPVDIHIVFFLPFLLLQCYRYLNVIQKQMDIFSVKHFVRTRDICLQRSQI